MNNLLLKYDSLSFILLIELNSLLWYNSIMMKINLIKKMEEKRMKKFMSTLSLVFAIVMVMTSMVVPASASTTTSEETVKIVFLQTW